MFSLSWSLPNFITDCPSIAGLLFHFCVLLCPDLQMWNCFLPECSWAASSTASICRLTPGLCCRRPGSPLNEPPCFVCLPSTRQQWMLGRLRGLWRDLIFCFFRRGSASHWMGSITFHLHLGNRGLRGGLYRKYKLQSPRCFGHVDQTACMHSTLHVKLPSFY